MAIECVSPLFSIYNERNSVLTSAAVALSSAWDYRRKKVTRGEDMQGRQAKKGMVCLQIERLLQSINQRMALKERPLGTEKQVSLLHTHLKKWSSSAELLHLSCGLSIQFPRHPVLRIFHFEARIG